MNPQPQPSSTGPADGANDEPAESTSGTDIQPEDTRTAESGSSGGATPAEKAMKQTSKTPAEQDGKG